MYKLIFMTQAQKDAKNLSSSGLKPKAMKLFEDEKLIKVYRMWKHYE